MRVKISTEATPNRPLDDQQDLAVEDDQDSERPLPAADDAADRPEEKQEEEDEIAYDVQIEHQLAQASSDRKEWPSRAVKHHAG